MWIRLFLQMAKITSWLTITLIPGRDNVHICFTDNKGSTAWVLTMPVRDGRVRVIMSYDLWNNRIFPLWTKKINLHVFQIWDQYRVMLRHTYKVSGIFSWAMCLTFFLFLWNHSDLFILFLSPETFFKIQPYNCW